jgi:hypothetical protein
MITSKSIEQIVGRCNVVAKMKAQRHSTRIPSPKGRRRRTGFQPVSRRSLATLQEPWRPNEDGAMRIDRLEACPTLGAEQKNDGLGSSPGPSCFWIVRFLRTAHGVCLLLYSRRMPKAM